MYVCIYADQEPQGFFLVIQVNCRVYVVTSSMTLVKK